MSNVYSEVVSVSPSLAASLLEHNDNNRPISKHVVDFYAEEMKNGKWVLNGESIKIAENGNLVDGQHRCLAIIKSGMTISMVVTRGLEEQSFRTIDQGKARTLRDITNCANIDKASQKSAIAGKYFPLKRGNYITDPERRGSRPNNAGKGKMSKSDMLDFIIENDGVLNEVIDSLKNLYEKTKFMQLSTMGAIALYLVLDKGHHIEKIADFFTQLSTGNTELNCISELHMRIISQSRSKTMNMTSRHMQNLIAKCWNYYIKGRDVVRLKWMPEREGDVQFI